MDDRLINGPHLVVEDDLLHEVFVALCRALAGELAAPERLDELRERLNELSEQVLVYRLRSRAGEDLDREALAAGEGFVADLLALRDELREGDGEAARGWLAPLLDDPRLRPHLARVEEDEVQAWLDEAERLLVDRLLPGSP